MVKIVKNGKKWSKSQKWLKLSKIIQNGSKMSSMVQNGQQMVQMVKNGQKWRAWP